MKNIYYCSVTDSSTIHSECFNGDIRLAAGSTPLEGRLEMCINSAWGTVCNNLFGKHDAAAACYQLGFKRAGEYTLFVYTYIRNVYSTFTR